MSDEQLKAKTAEFKEILANRKTADDFLTDRALEKEVLDKILPEAFAVVREAGKRVLNMRHFDVQLVGGVFFYKRSYCRDENGRRENPCSDASCYLNALTVKGVILLRLMITLQSVTVSGWVKIIKFLGLTVGVVLSGTRGENDFE